MKTLLWTASFVVLMLMAFGKLGVQTQPHASLGLTQVEFGREFMQLVEFRCAPLDEEYMYCRPVISGENVPAFQALLQSAFPHGRE